MLAKCAEVEFFAKLLRKSGNAEEERPAFVTLEGLIFPQLLALCRLQLQRARLPSAGLEKGGGGNPRKGRD